ncbi:hypothetical protein Ddye_028508 [Dipteronia dyeriana]|uniref:Phorbol-ester/DAG-type domain-containing protein n=1 Tax=Dipteronia dyeriana TaxID=168575 RepID=A0AAD9TD13_9ROSI|nr:hypothetical protein Ddye_028508 [Dipteronia dyeriana]
MEEIFLPEFHPHNLQRKIYNNQYGCDGCREYGFSLTRFKCKQCDFDLHEECAHVKQNTTHDLYNNNIFKFFPKPRHHQSIIHCAVCGDSVKGFEYNCEELELCMHPRCHSLPSKFRFYHLEFMMSLDSFMSSECLWCSHDSIGCLNATSIIFM